MANEFTKTELQSQLRALIKARNSGVLRVEHGDTVTQFQSLADLNKVILTVRREIATMDGTSRKRVNYISQCTKGL